MYKDARDTSFRGSGVINVQFAQCTLTMAMKGRNFGFHLSCIDFVHYEFNSKLDSLLINLVAIYEHLIVT